MPLFEYKGLDRAGKSKKGSIDAENVRAARLKLKKDGIFVTDIKNKQKAAASTGSLKKVSSGSVPVRDLAMMVRQLATMLKAKIPLVDTLSAVSDQVENPTLKDALSEAKNLVNEGSPFYKTLERYPKVFDKIFVSMAEAGEASGTLDTILIRLAEFTEAQDQLNSKVKSALMYPIIMMVITVILLMGLFIFVIPQMVAVFESSPDLQLPWYSVAIIDLSGIMVNYWYLIIGFFFGAYFIFLNWKNSVSGSRQWDAISLKLPVIGAMNRMVAVSRFTRTLATLLTGGVPMLQALEIVKNVVNNAILADAIDDARSNITEGENIATPLRRSGQFPPIVIHMVSIGEKTGELENMLIQVSDAYDFQVKNKVEGLTSIMAPVVIVVMGIVIGIIVFAIMIPMFEMSNIAG
ncbi:MAG: type secretion system protein GspF [Pseudomonadota bacterium]|jgi:general secretion pathway protein F